MRQVRKCLKTQLGIYSLWSEAVIKAKVRDTKAVRTEARRIPKVVSHSAIKEARHLAKATKAKERAHLIAIATIVVSMVTEQLTALSRGRTEI